MCVRIGLYKTNVFVNQKFRFLTLLLFLVDDKAMDKTSICSVYVIFFSVLRRPRSLLVFVNPYGGKRRAPRVYEESVGPLFDLAKIKTHVISM